MDTRGQEKISRLPPGPRGRGAGGNQPGRPDQVLVLPYRIAPCADREAMKNASRTKVREATDRGSTLFYHSRRPVDAGQTEGFHIPRAPGRTFTAPAAGALAAGDAPSLFFGSAVTLPDQHAIPFTLCILTGFERGVKRQLHAGISRPCALTAHLLLHTEYAGMWKPSPLSTGG